MKKSIKISLCIILILSILTTIIVCSFKTKEINFTEYTEKDLFKLTGKKVEICGYYMLNPVKNQIGYISNIPYKALATQTLVEQTEDSDTLQLYRLVFEKDNVIAVSFKKTPKYASVPVKITGVLEMGPFTDTYGFAYNFRIKDAEVEPMDIQYLPAHTQIYYDLAEQGYMDVVYSAVVNLEVFSLEFDAVENGDALEFPEFENYEDIKKVLENKKTNYIEKNFLDLFNSINDVYETHENAYKNNKLDINQLNIDINNIYLKLNSFIVEYALIAPYEQSVVNESENTTSTTKK